MFENQSPPNSRSDPADRPSSLAWMKVFTHPWMPARIPTLTFLSVLYLALPYGLFAAGWLRWPYAIVVGLLLVAGLLAARRPLGPPLDGSTPPIRGAQWGNFVFVLLTTAILLRYAGVGGVGSQQTDWIKHNAVLHDLTVFEWPVRYAGDAARPQGACLTYYIAYYLPAAAVGKIFGLGVAHWALFVWTFLGLLLCAAWLGRLLGNRSWVFWGAWFLMSGMDAVGVSLRGGGYHFCMEWWAIFGQLSSNMSLLVWVPQHMLGGWLATGLIVDRAERYGDLSLTGMVAALTSLWSPFVTLGLVPFAIVLVLRGNRRSAFTFANLVAMPVIVLLGVAYLTSLDPGGVPRQWGWQEYGPVWFFPTYLVFLFLEFGFCALLLAIHMLQDPPPALPSGGWNRVWLGMAVLVLIALPLYRVGISNDLLMRCSIPALFVFWVVALRVVSSSAFRLDTWRSSFLLLTLFLGAIQPMFQLAMHVVETGLERTFCSSSLEKTVPMLMTDQLPQYLGRPGAFFYQHLARDSSTGAVPHSTPANPR